MKVTDEAYRHDAVRSIWLHRAVLGHLSQNPEAVLRQAEDVLTRRLSKPHPKASPRPYYERWLGIIRSGPETTAEVLIQDSEEADVLRSCTPFTRVLSSEERRQVLACFERHWTSVHGFER